MKLRKHLWVCDSCSKEWWTLFHWIWTGPGFDIYVDDWDHYRHSKAHEGINHYKDYVLKYEEFSSCGNIKYKGELQ